MPISIHLFESWCSVHWSDKATLLEKCGIIPGTIYHLLVTQAIKERRLVWNPPMKLWVKLFCIWFYLFLQVIETPPIQRVYPPKKMKGKKKTAPTVFPKQRVLSSNNKTTGSTPWRWTSSWMWMATSTNVSPRCLDSLSSNWAVK